jgi:Ca2+-binding RTX toxin-like protein
MSLRRNLRASHRLSRRGRTAPRRPRLEVLEDRIVLWNTYVSLGDADAVWSFTNLSYSYSNLLDGWLNDDGMTTSDITDAVEESMGAWTAVTPLTFFQLPDSGPAPGDGQYDPIGRPFLRWGHHYIDGGTGLNVLAHGQRPGDNGINGDMHFDDGNTWTFNSFMETAIHEFGHAIGMAHANGDVVNGQAPAPKPAIMDALAGSYSFNGRGSAFLFQDDVDGIRSLYGSGLGYVINSSGSLNIYGTGASDTIVVNSFFVPFSGWFMTASSNSGSFTRSLGGVTSIRIHGLGGDDFLRVEGNGGVPTYIYGDGGNDFIDFSLNARNLGNITGRCYAYGGAGTDSIFVYDDNNSAATTYSINSVSVDRPGFGGFTYGVDIEGLTVRTGSGADTVNIPSTYPGQPVFLNSSGGRDTVNLGGPGAGLSNIRADVQVQNDPNYTLLNINDTGNTAFRNARIDRNGSFGYVTGLAPANIFWDIADIDSINITTGSADDVVNVVRNTETLTLNSAAGRDTVNLGNSGNMQEITGNVTIRNSPSFSRINLDDTYDPAAHSITMGSFSAADGLYGSITGIAPGAIYYRVNDTSELTVRTGSGSDSVYVASVRVPTSLIGRNADWVYVGLPGSNMADIISPLSISNPLNRTNLVLNDSNDASPATIAITDTYVAGLSPGVVSFVANDLLSLYIYAGSGGNTVNVLNTPANAAGLTTFVSSGAGSDVVNVRRTTGPLQVRGGGGSDIVHVGDAGSVANIQGSVDVQNYQGGTVLGIHDDADATARTATLELGRLSWTAYAAPVTWVPTSTATGGVTYLGIDLGTAADTLLVEQTDALNSYTYVQTGAGNDQVTVRGTSGGLYVYNAAGNDSTTIGGPGRSLQSIQGIVYPFSASTARMALSIDASGDTGGRAVTLSDAALTGLSPATIYFNVATSPNLSIKTGSGNDTLTLSGVRSGPTYNFDGGGGSDILQAENATNTWSLTAANAGSLFSNFTAASTPYNYTFGFSGVESLVGNDSNDNFSFKTAAAALSGFLDGGAGTNKLDYSAGGSAAVIVNLAASTASRVGGFSNITTFLLGPGIDTVIGANLPNIWTINKVNGVTVAGLSFTNVEHLVGGTASDTFKFSAGKSISGLVEGGGGVDTLDYSAYTTGVNVNLGTGAATATGGVANIANVTGGKGDDVLIGDAGPNVLRGTSGVDILRGAGGDDTLYAANAPGAGSLFDGGGGNDTLVGANVASTWLLTGANSGTLNAVAFSGVENLTGGSAADLLSVRPGGSLSGVFAGGSGTDALSYADLGSAATINLQNASATALGGFLGVEQFVGGGTASATTLQGKDANTTWTINGAGAGTLTGSLTFSGIRNLTGGSAVDTFKFTGAGGIAGQLDGGGGSDVLDYSAYASAVTVRLANSTATGTGGFASIEKLVGSAQSDTLIGPNAANAWAITANNAGKVGAFQFSGVENLTGGSSTDTFKFTAGMSVSGVINGGGGVDTLDYTAYTTSVTVNLATGAATSTGGVSNIENVTGGAAADTLIGDGGNNVLRGGKGDDTINGGDGRDLLIGGAGADSINGGGGDDIIISQGLSFETDAAALAAVMAEWTRADLGYAARVANLKNGGGLNGTTKLAAGNLVDDAIADLMLAGAGGNDWFLVKTPPDTIADLAAGEIVN